MIPQHPRSPGLAHQRARAVEISFPRELLLVLAFTIAVDVLGGCGAQVGPQGGAPGAPEGTPQPPVITTQPDNQTVVAGQSATFAVVATGTAPLSYQWQKNGANIAGASSRSYTTPPTVQSDSGSMFRVMVANPGGSVTSAAATLTVTGSATPGIQVDPSAISFGNEVVGSAVSQPVMITNTGTATLIITHVSANGARFQVGDFTVPMDVGPGQRTTITVTFQPTTPGPASGNISIASNAPTSPTTIGLSGTGVATTKTISVNPTSLSFGDVNVGGSSSQSITITNTGNSTVNITQLLVTGNGFTTTGSPTSLLPTQSVMVTVVFAPASAGPATGTLSIVSDATGSPATVNLSGTGVTSVTHSVELSWTASTSAVTGYNVYRSILSGGPYTKINGSLVSGLSYTDSTVGRAQTYYYVVTSVDASGAESSYSNEVLATIP